MTIIQCDLCHNTIDTMRAWITITVNADKGKGCHLDEDRDLCYTCVAQITKANQKPLGFDQSIEFVNGYVW